MASGEAKGLSNEWPEGGGCVWSRVLLLLRGLSSRQLVVAAGAQVMGPVEMLGSVSAPQLFYWVGVAAVTWLSLKMTCLLLNGARVFLVGTDLKVESFGRWAGEERGPGVGRNWRPGDECWDPGVLGNGRPVGEWWGPDVRRNVPAPSGH